MNRTILGRVFLTQRIHLRLFSVAADYTATAAWSAIDARKMERASQFLGQALHLAGMAKDPIAEMRVWNSYAMLAHHREEAAGAVDAAYAAQGTTIARCQPFFSYESTSQGVRRKIQYGYGHAQAPARGRGFRAVISLLACRL